MKTSTLKIVALVFGLLLSFNLIIVSFIGCQTKDDTSDEGTVPAVTWIADGIISPGEYAKTNDYGNYQIHWSSD
jgi:hypothetical protein